MTKTFLSLIMLLTYINGVNAQQMATLINESFSFESTILSDDREIWVHTPKIEENSLDNSQSIFPVIYVLDGEHNFLNVVGISQALARASLMPNVIVVGISGLHREYDYSPTYINVDYMKTGGGPNFLSFLSNELVPYINKEYPSSNHNTIVGHSIGAMFALYTLVEDTTDVFNNYLAISPSLWWDNQSLALSWRDKLNRQSFKKSKLTFVTMANEATLDGDGEIMHNQYLQLKTDVKNSTNFKIDYLDLFEEDHLSTVTPAVHNGFKFLFQNWNIDHHYSSNNFSNLKKALESLSEIYNFNVAPDYAQLVNMGRYYYEQKKYKIAIDIYEFGLITYAEGLQINGFAAQAYLKDGQTEKAKEYFNKGLRIAISKQSPMTSWFEDQLKEF